MIGVIVVLFRPNGEQLQRLQTLVRQFPLVVAVSNSPVGDGDGAAPSLPGLVCLPNGNAGGIAGAFNRGAEWMAAHHATAFVLLDQDSLIPDHFHTGLAACTAALLAAGQPCFLLGPRVYDINLKRHLPAFLHRPACGDTEQPRRCDFLISSGCLVTLAAWRRLGPWCEDFIIDHVDSEYCMRAHRQQVPMYHLANLELRHAIGQPVVRRWFGRTIGALNHSASRRYYQARNAVAAAWLHPMEWRHALGLNLLTVWQVLMVLALERDKWRKLAAVSAGCLDGLRRRGGPVEQLHPRLATYLGRALPARPVQP